MQCNECGNNMYFGGIGYPLFTKRKINGRMVAIKQIAYVHKCSCGNKVTIRL